MTANEIPIARVDLGEREIAYAKDALESGWISSIGPYVDSFENKLGSMIGDGQALSVSNGTVALHLALVTLGIGPGDEVLVPALTYIASVNAIRYVGAKPIFVDSTVIDWNMDLAQAESMISSKTKAILLVHLYGHPADSARARDIANRHGLYLVEDVAEAPFAQREGTPVASLADIATFSFFGNKAITTGEGGAVYTRNPNLADAMRMYRNQGQPAGRRYFHTVVGYNYRMTNICAAIGLGQLERWDEIRNLRQDIFLLYRQLLAGSEVPFEFQRSPEASDISPWMMTVALPPSLSSEPVIALAGREGVELRPVFVPIPDLPPYAKMAESHTYKNAREISDRGICLPTFNKLTRNEIETVVEVLLDAINQAAKGVDS